MPHDTYALGLGGVPVAEEVAHKAVAVHALKGNGARHVGLLHTDGQVHAAKVGAPKVNRDLVHNALALVLGVLNPVKGRDHGAVHRALVALLEVLAVQEVLRLEVVAHKVEQALQAQAIAEVEALDKALVGKVAGKFAKAEAGLLMVVVRVYLNLGGGVKAGGNVGARGVGLHAGEGGLVEADCLHDGLVLAEALRGHVEGGLKKGERNKGRASEKNENARFKWHDKTHSSAPGQRTPGGLVASQSRKK